MLCNVEEKRVSENIKERRKIYDARDFFGCINFSFSFGFALRKYNRIFFPIQIQAQVKKFQFSNRYNFCSDELFRVKSTKMSKIIKKNSLLSE
jgi:hypothetical protein